MKRNIFLPIGVAALAGVVAHMRRPDHVRSGSERTLW
jgi:hypothetical protein